MNIETQQFDKWVKDNYSFDLINEVFGQQKGPY